ncbi:MAG: hypothetical protein O2865_13895 [Planctomycetota bacterium]|nr:hypothetical protein [Planctomycetota bacterium]MDA0933787.1 hypothetical protein [Planctomycetota bacterium]
MSPRPTRDPSTASRAARVFVALAWLAVFGHLAMSTHHASVAHEHGADGHLHHVCASHADPVGSGSEDGDDSPDPREGDGDGEPCPLQKPCVDTGLGLHLAGDAWTPWNPSTPRLLIQLADASPLDVLDVAPKQSPPRSSPRS